MKTITLKSTGTYEHEWLSHIHTAIPAEAIEVTDAVFDDLSQNSQTRKYDPAAKIVSDVVKTQSELDAIKSNEERGWRNAELRVVDVDILKAEDTSADTATLRAYRQALRDYPQESDFPYGTRPVA